MDGESEMKKPLWAFQTSLRDPLWMHVKVDVCHPLVTPVELRGHLGILEQLEQPQDPIKAALESGVFLTARDLKALHTEFRYKLPAKGQGHGKQGGMVKQDWADAALSYFFGAGLDRAARKNMMDALLGKSWNRNGTGCHHSDDILAAFKAMDPQDQPAFVKLAAVAADEAKLTTVRAERADLKAYHMTPQHETPNSLRTLLPTGASFQCRFNRHPKQMRYQVYVFDAKTGSSTPSGPVSMFLVL